MFFLRKIVYLGANYAGKAEKLLCYSALSLMAILPVFDAIFRPLNVIIPFSSFTLFRLFLIAALFAAALCTLRKEHISIGLKQLIKSDKIKSIISVITDNISAFVITILFWNSLVLVKYLYLNNAYIGYLPEWLFPLIMAFCFIIMAIRFGLFSIPDSFLLKNNKSKILYLLPLSSIVLGCLAATPAIVKIIWGMEGETGFNPPPSLYLLADNIYVFIINNSLPLIIFFIIAALSGTPIFIVIGGIAQIMYMGRGLEPETGIPHILSTFTEDMNMIAIPLFTLTGFFLSESKAGGRLVLAFKSIFSWIPGGIIIATVVICAFFTSFTGASGITILALGGILYTILKEKSNYPENFSIGLLTSAGNVGLLFPPSFVIILVASTTSAVYVFMGHTPNFDIFDFFLGALIPGIILVLSRILIGLFISVKVKIPVEKFKFKEAASSIKGSFLEILLPFILITGFLTGILPSLLELSAVAVIYVFIVEVFIHKDIAIKNISKVFFKAIPIIGGILIILSMAKAFSHVFIDSGYTEQFTEWMQVTVESRVVFLLILNLALLVLGCFIDIFSAIAVALPLIIPLAISYGIDPIHLGVIFIINMELGYLTPPVGLNLYLASYRFNKPFLSICRYVLPFLFSQLLVVFLITYVPWFSTFLVQLFK